MSLIEDGGGEAGALGSTLNGAPPVVLLLLLPVEDALLDGGTDGGMVRLLRRLHSGEDDGASVECREVTSVGDAVGPVAFVWLYEV